MIAFDGSNVDALPQLLKQLPLHAAELCSFAFIPDSWITVEAPLLLVMTSCTAYHTPLAQLISQTLTHELALSAHQNHNLRSAVHEALCNAIIHGNLGLHPPDDRNSETLNKRLDDIAYSQRPICITVRWAKESGVLECTVYDQGEGFDHRNRKPYTLTEPHGRGLHIIHECTASFEHCDGGRGIIMRFRL